MDNKDEEMKKDMESPPESVEKVEPSNVEGNKEKTYTRDEVNKMINAEKQKERQAMLEEMEAKKAEADKLAIAFFNVVVSAFWPTTDSKVAGRYLRAETI